MVELADEILILDSLSTDKTKSLVKGYPYPVRFFESPFAGYGNSKNKLESWADGDFIFSIDADEVVSEELKRSILQEKSGGFPGIVYDLKRANIYCGKAIRFGGWNPDIKTRLWKKGSAKWDLSEVHENLIVVDNRKGKLLSGPLYHYSYRSIKEHFSKVEKYSQKGAFQLNRAGKKASFFKLIFSPLFRFIRDYFLKLGFLDGKYGFYIARITAFEVYLKYLKLIQLQKDKS